MCEFHSISTKKLTNNTFKMIGNDWMLITAKKDDQVNTMTASWGGFGVMWGKDVAYIVIRPQRYTKEFVDASETFSLSFFDDKYRATLAYCGKVSGRDEDKIEKTGLTTTYHNETPYFKEANTVLICKKLYKQTMCSEGFLTPSFHDTWYPSNDLHTLYIAEITDVLIQNNTQQ